MKSRRPAPRFLDVARQVLALQGGDGDVVTPDAVARVGEALAAHLVKLVGAAGFRALFERGVTLARRDHPWLPAAAAAEAEPVWGPVVVALRAEEPDRGEAAVAVIAQLLTLFASFVGDSLTVRILAGIWPELTAAPLEPP